MKYCFYIQPVKRLQGTKGKTHAKHYVEWPCNATQGLKLTYQYG